MNNVNDVLWCHCTQALPRHALWVIPQHLNCMCRHFRTLSVPGGVSRKNNWDLILLTPPGTDRVFRNVNR